MADALTDLARSVRQYADETLNAYESLGPDHQSNEVLLARSAHDLASLVLADIGGKRPAVALFLEMDARVAAEVMLAVAKHYPKMPVSDGINMGTGGRILLLCPSEEHRE